VSEALLNPGFSDVKAHASLDAYIFNDFILHYISRNLTLRRLKAPWENCGVGYYSDGSGISVLWIILLVVLVVVLAGMVTGSSSTTPKLEESLEKDVDKIFNTLVTQAQKFSRPETVQVLNDARAQVLKVLRDRKLL